MAAPKKGVAKPVAKKRASKALAVVPFKNALLVKKKPAKVLTKSRITKKQPVFTRHSGNPIIKPHATQEWESKATFNPTAIFADGRVHIVYRAIGVNDVSTLGYAESASGLSVEGRLPEPCYHTNHAKTGGTPDPRILYGSGGGWNGGCEDPRLTILGDRVYLLYTAFDGWGSVRIALSSIALEDFLNKKWDWRKPVLISAPGEINKNWVLFPEKIKGKYAILHSISPEILIDTFDSLEELDGKTFIQSTHKGRSKRTGVWDSFVRGVGPAPIKTKLGWLVLYHGMDDRDPNRYKLGAMILDAKDPTKVLYRAKEAILAPDEPYENEGLKSGVIYSCGAVVIRGELFVYYGGADYVTCVATANLDKFLAELVSTRKTTLKKKKTT